VQNESEPTGVIPLKDCNVELMHFGTQEEGWHSFVIHIRPQLVDDGIMLHKKYILAAETSDECQAWVGRSQNASLKQGN